MTRISLSDMVQIQADTISRYEVLFAKVLESLTAPRQTQAAQTVKLARGATGDHTTGVAIELIVQEGETEKETAERARVEYERLCARYPLPSGYAHAAPLGDEASPAEPPTLVEQLEGSVKK